MPQSASAAEANVDFAILTARLKPPPANKVKNRVSPQPLAQKDCGLRARFGAQNKLNLC